jgi:adenylosuccinate lyase
MIPRYEHPAIAGIWSEKSKLEKWQEVELAVINARTWTHEVDAQIFSTIKSTLESNPADITWWKEEEKKTRHDLQAWVSERVRHLPIELRPYFHDGMTSYDTEETAFLMMLKESAGYVCEACGKMELALSTLAVKYRYCPMMGVTHGQHAEVQSFGKRCLTWYQEISTAKQKVSDAFSTLNKSRLSGAIGNYGGVNPTIEEQALGELGFRPFYGATQILPRQLFVPLASALATLVSVISKIAIDIRLGARSPRPIYQEPFGKNQTGSSAMPHKKNTILCEQLEGMERMALGFLMMIMQNIKTWEERAIEQSSVERIAWPDLFHVAMRSLTSCTKVIEGLRVYPDNMILDIVDSKGTWAAGEAKKFLRPYLAVFGVTTEDVYRIVQLASFNVFEPSVSARNIREMPPTSFEVIDDWVFKAVNDFGPSDWESIKQIIERGELEVADNLANTKEQVDEWNAALKKFFHFSSPALLEWQEIFLVKNRLEDEGTLFQKILGC